jgi:hypothetical protein
VFVVGRGAGRRARSRVRDVSSLHAIHRPTTRTSRGTDPSGL